MQVKVLKFASLWILNRFLAVKETHVSYDLQNMSTGTQLMNQKRDFQYLLLILRQLFEQSFKDKYQIDCSSLIVK